ncbi:MAG: DUF434 domain-containing protein [Ruminococcaceae bacterium]|nr:DUF434 domain-containing protein [Oscillospiraceae bacterium]
MSAVVRRGHAPNDHREFFGEAAEVLFRAGRDLHYLLNQGYAIKGASTFVSNHYLLSERQRLALARAISSDASIGARREKEITDITAGCVVNIDGFNTIITLEVALSGSVLLRCMDGTVRDLAELRGTYRLIDKTDAAIMLIGKALESSGVSKAVFYLDAPVSNVWRLKQRIIDLWKPLNIEVQVEVTDGVDRILEKLGNVITGDAIILDNCISWINLNRRIIEGFDEGYPFVDFLREL